jgi:uncharacterized OB-fold protein
VPVSGDAAICSWTVVRQALLPGFETDLPYVIVDVELLEQPDLRMTGRLVDGVGASIVHGARVHVVFEDVAEGVSVPAFALGVRP